MWLAIPSYLSPISDTAADFRDDDQCEKITACDDSIKQH